MDRPEELFHRIEKQGLTTIEEFIRTRQSEEFFLDFKRSANDGAAGSLHQGDRQNLAKALSGFSNSEGGVLVWGVDCSQDPNLGDVAKAKIPLIDAPRFLASIEGAISGLTVPPVQNVRNIAVVQDGARGYVTTLIPKSQITPHESLYNHQYYMRAGSSFVPVPQGVLAGMFGRRPQPNVFVMYTIGNAKREEDAIIIQVGILLHNGGAGIARDIFLNGRLISEPGDNCKMGFELTDRQHWTGNFAFGFRMNIIASEGLRLAPESEIQPVVFNLHLKPPFTRDLKVDLHCGADGSLPHKGQLTSTAALVKEAYDKLMSMNDLKGTSGIISRMIGNDTEDRPSA
ncbi:MAG: ATP-binding protein [Elusimicrobiota bacterium]|jgi:hypothetical protein